MTVDMVTGHEATEREGGTGAITVIGRSLRTMEEAQQRAATAERYAAIHLDWRNHWEGRYQRAEARNAHLRAYNAKAHTALRRWQAAASWLLVTNVALLLAVVLLAFAFARMGA